MELTEALARSFASELSTHVTVVIRSSIVETCALSVIAQSIGTGRWYSTRRDVVAYQITGSVPIAALFPFVCARYGRANAMAVEKSPDDPAIEEMPWPSGEFDAR